MAIKFPAALRSSRADTITTRAGASALLRIYSGTQPVTADTAIGAQVLLAELTCNATFAPGASSGVLTLNAIASNNAVATGTAAFFRLVNSAGTTTVMDGSVSAAGGGGDLQLVSTAVTSGQAVSVSSFVYTDGNA